MLHTKRLRNSKQTRDQTARRPSEPSERNETKQRDERQRKCHFTACLTEKWTLSCEYDDGEDEEMTRWCHGAMVLHDDVDDDYDDGDDTSNKQQAN